MAASLPAIPKDIPRWMYEAFRRLQFKTVENSQGLAAVGRGEMPDGSGVPLPTPNLIDYWYKPGVTDFGVAYGGKLENGDAVISSTAHDTKGFVTLGSPTARVSVDESFGYVGINNDAPVAALDIIGTANAGDTTIVPNSDIAANWAPDSTHYYTSLGGAQAVGSHYTALASDDGSSSFVAILEAPTPNGTNPEKLGLNGTIVPGTTYIVTAKMFTLGSPIVDPDGALIISLVDSAGDQWQAVVPNQSINGLTSTPTIYTFEITCAGSAVSSGNAPNAVWLSAAGDVYYVCCTYVAIVGSDEDLTHWSDSDETLRSIVDPTGRIGIGVTSDLEAQLHIATGAAGALGQIIRAASSQTANLLQFQSSLSAVLSGFNSLGAYYLTAGAGVGKVLTSDVNGLGAWATPATQTSTLLDGTVHTDTVAQTVSRGSLVYGNSTPKWDELVVGAANTVLKSDGTDPAWAAIDHNFLSNRTRATDFFGISDWAQANGTAIGVVIPGTTWPDFSGPALEFVTAPGVTPQGMVAGSWVVPRDYVSGNFTVKVLWTPKVTGAGVDTFWRARVHLLRIVSGTTLFDAAATTYEVSLLADATTPAKTFYLSTITSAASLSGLAAGECVRVGFDRETADAADDYEDSVYVYGLVFEYTADM